MSVLQSTVRWSYRIFWYCLITAIILLAIAISMIRIFLPDVKVYREHIEQMATSFLEQEVKIESMDARLSGLTPLIIFKDVHLLDAAGEREIARFDEARLGIDLWRSISNGKLIPSRFTVYGVKLGVVLNEDGSLTLRGLELLKLEQQLAATVDAVSHGTGDLARWLFERSEISLRDSTIIWQYAQHNDRRIRFDHVNLDLRNDGDRHQLNGRVSLPDTLGRDVEIALDFRGNFLNPRNWQGGFYVRGREIHLENWDVRPTLPGATIEQGLLDVSLWGEWQAGQLSSLSAALEAHALILRPDDHGPVLDVNHLKGLFDWSRQAQGWVLEAKDLQYMAGHGRWPATRLRLEYNDHAAAQRVRLFSSFLRLQDVSAIAQHSNVLSNTLRETLAGLNPHGDVTDLHLAYTRDGEQSPRYRLSANLKDVGIEPWHKFPGFASLAGVLLADEQAGTLQIDDSELQVAVPNLFRERFNLNKATGRLDWWRDAGNWHLRSRKFELENDDVSVTLMFEASIPDDEASPWLDLQAEFHDGDVQAAWRYLPVSIMSVDLVHWLDTSLKSGQVLQGRTLFSGRLKDFPFRNQGGTFVTEFQVQDVELEYRKAWPSILIKDGYARFTGTGMQIDVSEGLLYQNRLADSHIHIDDFRLPVLHVQSKLTGQFGDVVRFLVESPIAPQAKDFYTQSVMNGPASADLQLRVPLNTQAEAEYPLDYRGTVKLNGASLSAWDERLNIKNIQGRIDYSPQGIFSRKLTGLFTGQPTRFDLHTRQADDRQVIELAVQGVLDVKRLPARLPIQGLRRYLGGKASWQALLRFGEQAGDPHRLGSLEVTSSLEGIAIDLPVPLGKEAPAVSTVNLSLQFTDAGAYPLRISYGNVFNSALLIDTTADIVHIEKGVINFSTAVPELPQQEILLIRGSLPQLEIDVWRDIVRQMDFASALPGMEELGVPLVLDMEYLHIVSRDDDSTGKVEDPRKVSLVNGEIRQFRYNDMQLGSLAITTSRMQEGLRIEKLTFITPDMEVSGEGSWIIRDEKQRTNLLLMVSSEDVGNMVSSLGYRGVIRGGSMRAVVQANWDDAPNRFSYAKLNGSMGVVINDGTLSDVNPGAGRLFGLLSLSELPRRLTLDFSELKQGFNFKQIIGQIDIVDGDAYTDNMRIISPIALIGIEGRTGLASQDFDQDVTVIPNVSNTLPVISWLAWGGQIGALTLLLDQLFGEQMNESVAAHYRITGTWEQPDIERLQVPANESANAQSTE